MATKRPSYTTPVGTFGFPCSLTEPDTAFADKNNPNDLGNYQVTVLLPKDSAATKKFLADLEEIMERHLQETMMKTGKKNLSYTDETRPYKDHVDREGNPTGFVAVRTKLKARVVTKLGKVFDQRPKIFDTANNLLTAPPNIGIGSEGRVAGQVNCWFTSKIGVSLWCEGVQLHKLVERGGNSPEGFGFKATGDGYTEEESFAEIATDGGDF